MPLLLAAGANQQGIVQFLLALGADVNPRNKRNQTPLTLATRDGNEGLVKLLLDQPAIQPDVIERPRFRPNYRGETPLSVAAGNGYASIVRSLLETNRVNVNSTDQFHRTPLFYAVNKGHEEVVRILLTVPGIQVNARDTSGRTSLTRAAMAGQDNIRRLLLETDGVDINVPQHRLATRRQIPLVICGNFSRPEGYNVRDPQGF